jgi:hypothetical protein
MPETLPSATRGRCWSMVWWLATRCRLEAEKGGKWMWCGVVSCSEVQGTLLWHGVCERLRVYSRRMDGSLRSVPSKWRNLEGLVFEMCRYVTLLGSLVVEVSDL